MKSTILSAIALMTTVGLSAQNVPIDFEDGGFGATWNWTVFENDTNPALEIFTNPDMSGINTSGRVAKFTALQAGQPFAGCETEHGAGIGSFILTSATSTIKIMVWKSVISDVGIKLVDPTGASAGEIKVANSVTGAWEELVFDFSALEGISYDQLVVFPDFNARSMDNIIYFDNISFGLPASAVTPDEGAPAPTHLEEDVISMFSDSYTDVAVDTWLTGWSDASLVEINVDGNPTKLYSGLNFAGVEAVGSNTIDASLMDTFHLDMWSPDFTQFRLKLVDFGADGQFDGGDDSEHEITFDTPTKEEWISIDIPMTEFTGLMSSEHIAQVIFAGAPVGGATVYIDNVYWSKMSTVGVAEPSSMPATRLYPNPATDKLEISASDEILSLEVFSLLGDCLIMETSGSKQAIIDIQDLAAGTYILRIQSGEAFSNQTFIKR